MFQAILLVSLFNGLFSPIHHLVQQLVLINVAVMPGLAAGSGGSWLLQLIVPHAASLIVAFGTIFLAGVPAALYERLTGQQEIRPDSNDDLARRNAVPVVPGDPLVPLGGVRSN